MSTRIDWPQGAPNRERTLEILREHNAWRRGALGPQTDPRVLGLALDAAIEALASATEPPSGGEVAFAEWLAAEMPAGTVIGDPAWWAGRIARQYAKRCKPTEAQAQGGGEVVEMDMHKANGLLCDFAMRWTLDGDYLRCKSCKRPQLTSYADHPFPHADGCKRAETSERHPWRTFAALLAPLVPASAPPSAPVGVEWALSVLRAGNWREVHLGGRCMRLEVAYDYAIWESLMAEVEAALAQQPSVAPVGVIGDAMRHLSKWLDLNDCECESGHQCGRIEVERTRDQLRFLAQQPAADTLNAGRLKALHRGLELARKWATGTGVHGHTDTVVRSMAEELRVALSSQEGDYEQPAAVDGTFSLDAHKATLASLVAAVSLLRRGGRKAAPSDAMFNMMLADYEKAIEASRIALAAQPGGANHG